MTTPNPAQKRMARLLESLTTGEGIRPSALDTVKLMRASRSVPRCPVMYEPSIVIVCQGRKRGHLGGRTYVYDPHHYLVLSVPLPFECETEAADDGPMLGLSVRVDVSVVSELLLTLGNRTDDTASSPESDAEAGIASTPLDDAMSSAALRLLECLASPADAQILGPQIVREITYRVLTGPHGASLRALVAVNHRLGKIQRALWRMHAAYADPVDVATLSDECAMSPSSFHHHFKAVTATSPVQYLKSIRLHKARMLMVQEGLNAGQAASRVGYESPSQFSREFKRFFGAPPLTEVSRLRDQLGLADATPAHRGATLAAR